VFNQKKSAVLWRYICLAMPGGRRRSNTVSAVESHGNESKSTSKSMIRLSLMSKSLESFKLGGRRRAKTWVSNGDPTEGDEADGGLGRQLMSANPKFANGGGGGGGGATESVRPAIRAVSRLRRNTLGASRHQGVSVRSHSARRAQRSVYEEESAPVQVPEKLREQSERELITAMKKAKDKVEQGKLNGVVVEELSQLLAICKARGLMRHDCEVYDDACALKSRLRARLKNQLRQVKEAQTT
jgi:hypothetical protein